MNSIVHVVDDDDEVRIAVARLLRTEGYEVRSYASAGEFLLACTDIPRGCILLDLEMPGPSGLDLQQALLQRAPGLPVIFVTGRGDVPSSVRAMKAGAVDFLTKPVEPHVLLGAVRSAIAQDEASRMRDEASEAVAARYSRLSPRERSVFECVVAGKLNKQAADELGITERTVKMHRAQVMEKLEVRTVADLVQLAVRLDAAGISRPPRSTQHASRATR